MIKIKKTISDEKDPDNIKNNFFENKLKKIIAKIAAIIFCAIAFALSAGSADARVIKDIWDREVDIPDKVGSIIALGSAAPRLAAYLGVVDMMVGVEKADADNKTILRDYSFVCHEKIKDLPIVGSGGGSGQNNGFPEEIIKVAPDVIIAGFSAEAGDELQTQTGIPVVCIRQTTTGFINDSFYRSMRVFAEVVGRQDRCEKILDLVDGCKKDLADRTSSVADDKKTRAYSGGVTYNGRHGFTGTYSHFGPFIGVGAKNVADTDDVDGFYEVDVERVIVWDPDVIFVDPGNIDLVNDSYATATDAYASLRAIQEDRVYTMPSFNNMGTNITYALIDAYWAGSILFSDRFADIEIKEKASEIFTTMLGEDIFDAMQENGLYYGKIKIGR